MNWSTDLILAIYPLIQSFQALKKPRIAVLKHWTIFWIVWIVLHSTEAFVYVVFYLTSWIPLTNILFSVYNISRILVILANYSPKITYITHRTFLKFGYAEVGKLFKKLQNSDEWKEINQWIDFNGIKVKLQSLANILRSCLERFI